MGKDKLREFFEGSSRQMGVVMQGCFNMPLDHFLELYKHFRKTGQNLLDVYCEIEWLSWDAEEYAGEKKKHIKILNDKAILTIAAFTSGLYPILEPMFEFTKEDMSEIKDYIDYCKAQNFKSDGKIKRMAEKGENTGSL